MTSYSYMGISSKKLKDTKFTWESDVNSYQIFNLDICMLCLVEISEGVSKWSMHIVYCVQTKRDKWKLFFQLYIFVPDIQWTVILIWLCCLLPN